LEADFILDSASMFKFEENKAKNARELRRTTGRRIWEVLNSSFTLWVLTAAVGTFVTFTYANYQTCMRESDDKSTRVDHIQYELHYRQMQIVSRIELAETIEDLRSLLKSIVSSRNEFKDESTAALQTELFDVLMYVRINDEAKADIEQQMKGLGIKRDELPYFIVLSGTVPIEMDDGDLQKMKALLPKLAGDVNIALDIHDKWRTVPYCTLGQSIASLWRSRDKYLELRRGTPPLREITDPSSNERK
jgi:hypothetical protein